MKKLLKFVLIGAAFLVVLVAAVVLGALAVDVRNTTYLRIKSDQRANSLFIRNVKLVPMTSDTVIAYSDVRIVNGVIEEIGLNLDPSDLPELDGKGKYLAPGLIDMHVHVWDEYELGLYLSNGVTAIRNMWGQPMHLRIKEKANSESIYSPSFYTSGPKLTGPQFIGDDNVNLTSTVEAEKKITAYKERGYDFVKTYYGLTEELFDVILQKANDIDMEIAAHPTPEVPYSYHFNPQIVTIEHAEDFVQQPLRYELDTAKLDSVVAGYVANSHSSHCPTMTAFYNIYNMLTDEDILNSEEIQYMSPLIRKSDSKAQFKRWRDTKAVDSTTVDRIKTQHEFHLLIIRKLYENEVNIVSGTDAGIGVTRPGYSIHEELAFYTEAGMTNYDALKTATVNATRTHDFLVDLGSIEEGKRANLLLLSENPLNTLAALRKPEAVVIEGRVLDADRLELFDKKAKGRRNLIASAIRYAEYLLVER